MRGMSFAKQISKDELLYMREQQGMSNREIADALGVAYQTVLKRIGPQPGGRGGLRARNMIIAPPLPKLPKDDGPEAALVLEDQSVELVGVSGRYQIPYRSQKITMSIDCCEGSLTFPFSCVADLIKELNVIQYRIDHNQFSIPNEMW